MNKQFLILASLLTLMSSITIRAMDPETKAFKEGKEDLLNRFYKACMMENERHNVSAHRAKLECAEIKAKLGILCNLLNSKDNQQPSNVVFSLSLTDESLNSHLAPHNRSLLKDWSETLVPCVCKKDSMPPKQSSVDTKPVNLTDKISNPHSDSALSNPLVLGGLWMIFGPQKIRPVSNR